MIWAIEVVGRHNLRPIKIGMQRTTRSWHQKRMQRVRLAKRVWQQLARSINLLKVTGTVVAMPSTADIWKDESIALTTNLGE